MPSRRSAQSQPASENETPRKPITRLCLDARQRVRDALELLGGAPQLADRRLEIEELTLTLHRALVHAALFRDELRQQRLGIGLAEIHRAERARLSEQRADLGFF